MASTRKSRAVPPEPAPGTRRRILQTAWESIAARGDATLSLVDLAREAGVSRQTLYLLFGNRAGLLLAMLDHVDANSGIVPRMARARAATTPREAFEPYVRAWFDYLPQVLPVARALMAAATAGDTEARAAWDSRAALLRAGLLQMTRALHQAGALRPGWTPQTAADWLFNATHVDAWQHLVIEARWKPRDAADRIVAMLRATLLVDP